MSPNDDFEQLMLALIRQVMENRHDIEPNENFIYDVVFYTLHSPKLMQMISEKPSALKPSKSQLDSDDHRLTQIIELLALINRIIDHLSTHVKLPKSQDCPTFLKKVPKQKNGTDYSTNICVE